MGIKLFSIQLIVGKRYDGSNLTFLSFLASFIAFLAVGYVTVLVGYARHGLTISCPLSLFLVSWK